MYNAMSIDNLRSLTDLMTHFAKTKG
jgi:hypothetical protein